MAEERISFFLVTIVAIVAIVGMVTVFTMSTKTETVTTPTKSTAGSMTLDELMTLLEESPGEENIAGMAFPSRTLLRGVCAIMRTRRNNLYDSGDSDWVMWDYYTDKYCAF